MTFASRKLPRCSPASGAAGVNAQTLAQTIAARVTGGEPSGRGAPRHCRWHCQQRRRLGTRRRLGRRSVVRRRHEPRLATSHASLGIQAIGRNGERAEGGCSALRHLRWRERCAQHPGGYGVDSTSTGELRQAKHVDQGQRRKCGALSRAGPWPPVFAGPPRPCRCSRCARPLLSAVVCTR